MPTRLRIATCRELPEIDVDAEPLARALAAAGVSAELVAWDDPAADWDAAVPTLVRSTWNYALHLDAFLAWAARAARAAPLLNPLDVITANVRKRYLLELAARGVAAVPTALVERGATLDLSTRRERFVIKPEVGAGSLDARAFEPGDPAAAAHLAHVTARGAALVQPYMQSVHDHGERSLIWIDGEFTHEIRKTPRFSGDDEKVEGPFPIADDERATAAAAIAPYTSKILYGRVDLARGPSGQPMVMELELVEPSLFFARHPPALARFVAGLRRRLI